MRTSGAEIGNAHRDALGGGVSALIDSNWSIGASTEGGASSIAIRTKSTVDTTISFNRYIGQIWDSAGTAAGNWTRGMGMPMAWRGRAVAAPRTPRGAAASVAPVI